MYFSSKFVIYFLTGYVCILIKIQGEIYRYNISLGRDFISKDFELHISNFFLLTTIKLHTLFYYFLLKLIQI